MFDVIIGRMYNGHVDSFSVIIEGCPHHGIEAVDFRRKNKLPEAPSDKIRLPEISFKDECLCRFYHAQDKCNNDADVLLQNWHQKCWGWNLDGEIYQLQTRNIVMSAYLPYLDPEAIAAYLKDQRGWAYYLLEDMLAYEQRSLLQAKAKVAEIETEKTRQANKLSEARQLLESELTAKDCRIKELEDRVTELEEFGMVP